MSSNSKTYLSNVLFLFLNMYDGVKLVHLEKEVSSEYSFFP